CRGRHQQHQGQHHQEGQAEDGQAVHPPPRRSVLRFVDVRRLGHGLAWKVSSTDWSNAGLDVYESVTSTAERSRATTMLLVVALDGSVSAGWPATVVGVG